ncbi:sentrin-specific protease 1-like isoform X1 [Asterias rubens]|uniref:sentrin-specific protease 1-like isoform X1 n=1 Tax=Asterias rubens TaxID=7604 RepID=UPI0014553754|nr:sentrin-specific protease 1-like isoform X1 [Asterias rubens]
MVSKITSAFRTWIGSDGTPSGSGQRKRSWGSSDRQHVEQDILETPQAKRSKHSHEEATSPIVKVATWIKQKATTFGENYFYRPVDMQNGYENHTSVTQEPVQENPEQLLRRRPLHQRPKVAASKQPIREKAGPRDRRKHPQGPDTRRGNALSSRDCEDGRTSKATHHQLADPNSSSYSSASCRSKNHPKPVNRKMISSRPNNGPRHQGPLPTQAAPPSIGNSYTSVNQKLFPQTHIRKSSVSSDGGRSQSTASECVRLDQLQNYQHLLQQFTTANVSSFAMNSTLQVKDSTQKTMTRNTAKRRIQESTELGSVIARPKIPEGKTLHRTRVLPHEYNTQQEIREAARLRLHAPVSELSPSATPYSSRHTVATPAQPNFSRSESPIILAVKPAPKPSTSTRELSQLTAFERSLTSSPYALQDWVKDLKDRFESSVRLHDKNVEKERATVNVYKHQRDEQVAQISKKITEDMKIAERRAAVIEEPPTPEISEEESLDESSEEEEEDELPEMTEEMLNEVNNALKGQPTNEVLTEGFRLRLTRKDMATLQGLNWLNDEIINFYMNLLVERPEQPNSLHCFNTFFYPKLLKEGQTGLRRWTKKTDIFAKDMILVPIHLGMHWCMATIDFRSKSITYFDSMGGHNQKCLDALRDYLIDEHQDKKGSAYDITGWTFSCPKDIPQQMNGSDCGMFACKFADYVSRDKRITFTQHDMPYFRKMMVWELLHKKLL